jgi:diguanylate cyclase (GGDEF)-like protein
VLEASDPLLVQERLDSAFDTLVVEFSVAFFDRATQALAEQARSDALTGLLNHQAFWGDVTRELQRAQRYGHGITLIYFDIDHFKQINDTHGHPVGDRVLRGVADILALELRESDLVGRTGGDEFAACLVHSDVDVGPLFIPRLRSRVAELSGEPGMPPVLSIGAGCAHFPTEAGNAEALFELADARLYEAKRARNA